jgi:ABC-type dipeptide/oligopeptide/nickel transport system permease component
MEGDVPMRMSAYIIRRLLLLIPVLLGVTILVFTLTRITGDPGAAYITEKMNDEQIARIYEQYHLNDPIWTQYLYWLNGIIHGDWGLSKVDGDRPVTESIADYFPATFELTFIAMLIGILIGVFVGTAIATRKDKLSDHTVRAVSLLGVSIPIFWLGLLLLNVFYLRLDLFPAGGEYSDYYLIHGYQEYTGFLILDAIIALDAAFLYDLLWHITLPAITLAFGTIAVIIRIMRSSMLEVLNQDYVKAARAKGLPESTVIKRHARRNALIPTITVAGLAFGALLAGAVLTESIFNWPGLGRWSAQAILSLDWNSIMGFTLLVAIIYVIGNLIVDLLYAYLDPRVKLE